MSKITNLNPALLDLAPYNPRRTTSEESLHELADSIRRQGLLQPVLVRPVDGKFEVVCGSRRTRAAIIAACETIPVIIRELSDQEAIEAALTENIQRKDVEPIEEVEAIEGLSAFYDTDQAIGERLGRNAEWVSRRRKLLGLSDSLKESLRAKEFALGWYELASRLPHGDQVRVLELTRGWGGPDTPAKLRSYLKREAKPLAEARFDTTVPMGERPACTGCPRNTASQADLFGADEPALCQNRTCFDEKAAMFAQRFSEEQSLPLMEVHWDKPSVREEHYRPEDHQGYSKVVVGPGSRTGEVGEIRYVKLPQASPDGEPDPKDEARRAYLADCKKENFTRAELLETIARQVATLGEIDVENAFDGLHYIMFRATVPKGTSIRDSRRVERDDFMKLAGVQDIEQAGFQREPETRKSLLAFLIWRACHEELAQKDWPYQGDPVKPDLAIQEAYKALGICTYEDARAKAVAEWEDLPRNRKKEDVE